MEKKVYIARHGQTAWNLEKRFQGSNDIPLNATGRAQAGALAEVMKEHTVKRIYTSPKSRALETAEIVNEALKAELEIVEDLREITHGVYDGLTMDEVYNNHSDSIAKWRADRINVAPPGGESIRECAARVIPVYNRIITESRSEPIMIVSHMAVIKSILIHILEAPMETFWRFDQGSAALNVIRYRDEKGPLVELLNYTEHIKNLSE